MREKIRFSWQILILMQNYEINSIAIGQLHGNQEFPLKFRSNCHQAGTISQLCCILSSIPLSIDYRSKVSQCKSNANLQREQIWSQHMYHANSLYELYFKRLQHMLQLQINCNIRLFSRYDSLFYNFYSPCDTPKILHQKLIKKSMRNMTEHPQRAQHQFRVS